MIRSLLILMCLIQSSWALPVFNVNVATKGQYRVIWPDDSNPRLFYVLPKEFLIYEHSSGIHVSKNVLSTTFYAESYEQELKESMKFIRSKFPDELVEFVEAPLELEASEEDSLLTDFFGTQRANMPSLNDSSSYLNFSIVLREAGMKHVLPILKNGGEIPFSVKFKVKGFIKKVDGSMIAHDMKLGIPARLSAKRVVVSE